MHSTVIMESTQIPGSTIMDKRKHPAPTVKNQKDVLTPQVQARVDAIRKACPHLFLTPADVGIKFSMDSWPKSFSCATYEGIVTEGIIQGRHKFCVGDGEHIYAHDEWLRRADVTWRMDLWPEETKHPSALGTWMPGEALLLLNTARDIGKVFNFTGVKWGQYDWESSPPFQARFEGIEPNHHAVG